MSWGPGQAFNGILNGIQPMPLITPFVLDEVVEEKPVKNKKKYPYGKCDHCGVAFTEAPRYKGGQIPFGGDVICTNAGTDNYMIVEGVDDQGKLILRGHGHTRSFPPGGYMLFQRHPGAKQELYPAGQPPEIPIEPDAAPE